MPGIQAVIPAWAAVGLHLAELGTPQYSAALAPPVVDTCGEDIAALQSELAALRADNLRLARDAGACSGERRHLVHTVVTIGVSALIHLVGYLGCPYRRRAAKVSTAKDLAPSWTPSASPELAGRASTVARSASRPPAIAVSEGGVGVLATLAAREVRR